jgi:hypothetical protein
MSLDSTTGSAAPDSRRPSDRRAYVAPRLGPSESVRELTRASGGSPPDGGGSGGMTMVMV